MLLVRVRGRDHRTERQQLSGRTDAGETMTEDSFISAGVDILIIAGMLFVLMVTVLVLL